MIPSSACAARAASVSSHFCAQERSLKISRISSVLKRKPWIWLSMAVEGMKILPNERGEAGGSGPRPDRLRAFCRERESAFRKTKNCFDQRQDRTDLFFRIDLRCREKRISTGLLCGE